MLKLYGIAQSRAFRVLWMLEELGIPYEQVMIGFEKSRVVDPRLLAVNPNRKLPTIDDDGTILFESLAINLYLAEKHGGQMKWSNAAEAGRCYQWSLWAANEMEPKALAWGYEFQKAEAERNAGTIEAAPAAMHDPLAVLDGALTGKHYLAAERFTVADCNVVGVLFRLRAYEDLRRYSAVKEWMERCWARPAARKALELREG